MKPEIDKEFAALFPPLTDDELAQLEENLLAEGCRDALVVWGNILIDGHNRLAICEKHDIPFSTVDREFVNRDDAMRYIIENQCGRRNLNPAHRSILVMKLEPQYAERAKRNQQNSPGRGKKGFPHTGNLFSKQDTDKELAKVAGVSRDTIHKTRRIMENGTPAQVERVKKGGAGNSLRAVYNEVRSKPPLPPVVDTPHPEAKGTNVETPEEYKASLAEIRGIVADLKNPDLERTYTTDMFMVEYAAFANQFVRGLDTYAHEPYKAMYPIFTPKERKKMLAINEGLIEEIRNTNTRFEEVHLEET